MVESIEKRASETILQRNKSIEVGGVTYKVSPPSCATIILASEYISRLPVLEMDSANIINETLKNAKYCNVLGEIAAVLILGARGVTEVVEVVEKRFFGLLKRVKRVEVDRLKELSEKLLLDVPPADLHRGVIDCLYMMQVGDFFALTTSLIAINLTAPKKAEVVKKKTTAPGQ